MVVGTAEITIFKMARDYGEVPPVTEPVQDPVPPAVTTYGARPDNEAEPLYPGLVLGSKAAMAKLTRFLMESNASTEGERLTFRPGSVGHDLVVYPTNQRTVNAFLELGRGVGRNLFELVYE